MAQAPQGLSGRQSDVACLQSGAPVPPMKTEHYIYADERSKGFVVLPELKKEDLPCRTLSPPSQVSIVLPPKTLVSG